MCVEISACQHCLALYSSTALLHKDQLQVTTHSNHPITIDIMVPSPIAEMLERNSEYASTHTSPPGFLKMVEMAKASGSGVLVLSCSDPRVNPHEILGLDSKLSRVAMVRTAGGRAVDGIKSLAVLQTIAGPNIVVVMHHTDCGVTHFHDKAIREALTKIAPAEKERLAKMDFGEITGSIEESVREDLAILKNSPLLKKGTQFVGLKFDTDTGKLTVVE
ncbi:hypothetical protein Q7P36_002564 [Cladosporium allicinum]